MTYGGGKKRICEGTECSVLLSKYNAKEFCASCWDAIPLADRPYSYMDAWNSLPREPKKTWRPGLPSAKNV